MSQSLNKKKHHRNAWLTALIVAAWVVGCLVILAGIAIWIISYHLTPERITRLIEEKADEYLDAKLEIGKLDYKLFSTYPWLDFEVDSLTIISKSLHGLTPSQRALLPENADSLAFVAKLYGKVNVQDLMHKNINIKDVFISSLRANVVMYDDSVTNYNIVKTHISMPEKMPRIDLSELKIEPPLDLAFMSLPLDTEAKVKIEDFFLTRNADKSYDIGVEGIAKGHYRNFELPGELPFHVNTHLSPKWPDASINVEKLALGLPGLDLNFTGELNLTKTEIDLTKADLTVKIADVFSLPKLLPDTLAREIQFPDGLSGQLPLEIKANLLAPYNLPGGFSGSNASQKSDENSIESSDESSFFESFPLPSFLADIKIEDASLRLNPPGLKNLEADDIYLLMSCRFDRERPEENNIEIKEVRLHGEGISLEASALALLGGESQQISANIDFQSSVMETLAYFMPKNSLKVGGHLQGKVEFTGEALNYGKEGFKDILLQGRVGSRLLTIKASGNNIGARNFGSDFKARIPQYPLNDYSGTKMDIDLRSDSLWALGSGNQVTMTGLELDLNAMDTLSTNPDPFGNIHLKIKTLGARNSDVSFNGADLDLVANGALNSNPSGQQGSYPDYQPKGGSDDALIASRIQHTPLTLIYNGGGIISTIPGMLDLDADVKIGSGSFKTSSYLYPFVFKGADISTNLDRLNFFASEVKISDTEFSVSGEVDGLEPFLTSYSATPLKARADINFSNVDINRLAWGYYGVLVKQGVDSVFYVPDLTPYTASDSTCILLPRNIDADIRLRADRAQYMGYSFSPLSTGIIVKDGDATLKGLTIGAPYCTVAVDWTYSTSRLDNIFMDLKANVENFSFAPFYKVFPMIVDKAPELKNFTGDINADVWCHFRMFPDMFMNSESLEGKFDIRGTNLEFARQGKIERLTHLMLIEGDAPIKLHNLNITGGFHDFLLQVNPFQIAFDDYELKLGGVNNTSGNIYYHIALEKSPFHLPFGVSLIGNMKHPEVKLGGTRFDDYRSEGIQEEQPKKIDANIMAYLRRGWLLFIQEAAKYEK